MPPPRVEANGFGAGSHRLIWVMPPTIEGVGRPDHLQDAMTDHLGGRGVSDLSNGTIVVLPSITFPESELRKIIGIEHYEERMLCMSLLLRRPSLDVVYVTSAPVPESVIDYYLGFVPDVSDARDRLRMITLDDPKPRALSTKISQRPDVLAEIKGALRDPTNAYLFPFNVTGVEQRISEELGIALYGPRPELTALGSKSGSRRVAKVAGVPVAPGAEDLYSLEDVEQAVFELTTSVPGCEAVVVKLNNGFSGQGNAILEVSELTSPLDRSGVVFCASEESWPSFAEKIAAEGAVVEQLFRAERMASPSVQLRIFPDGTYEIVSTHDQILGGPDDQVYLGCRFPADDSYRTSIQAYGLGIARELAAHGVIGSFGVDFIVTPEEDILMTEINLRLGGTTHPFLTARLVTEGFYDMASGELVVRGRPKSYIATDNWKSPAYVGLEPQQVIDAADAARLRFDPDRGTGVVFHLLGALNRYGKLGATCIGDSAEDARRVYDETVSLLEGLS